MVSLLKKEINMAAPLNDNGKEKILKVTAELLKEKSFSDISLAEIAEKSGISKGSVYYYYKTKDEILCDVADEYFQQVYEEFIEWVDNKEKDTSLPRLLNFLLIKGVTDSAESLRLHLTMDAVAGNERIREKLLHRYNMFRILIGEKISERKGDKEAEYYGWLVLTLIDGLMIQSLLKNEEMNLEQFVEKFIKSIV